MSVGTSVFVGGAMVGAIVGGTAVKGIIVAGPIVATSTSIPVSTCTPAVASAGVMVADCCACSELSARAPASPPILMYIAHCAYRFIRTA